MTNITAILCNFHRAGGQFSTSISTNWSTTTFPSPYVTLLLLQWVANDGVSSMKVCLYFPNIHFRPRTLVRSSSANTIDRSNCSTLLSVSKILLLHYTRQYIDNPISFSTNYKSIAHPLPFIITLLSSTFLLITRLFSAIHNH